ncbi:MAG: hypothetical protein IT434_13390 [Phycisphaerales bacterium]|jgi:hypothetical protein|nr:hypothetical protein [Phycisphaerales bacterium]
MSKLKQTLVKFALFLSFSVAAATPICVKPSFSCSGTCGAAGFTICEEGYVPGSPGQFATLQIVIPAVCTTYGNAADTVTGVCGVDPPAGYDPVPLGCGGGQEGQCCYKKTLPAGPVTTVFYKNIIRYGGFDC